MVTAVAMITFLASILFAACPSLALITRPPSTNVTSGDNTAFRRMIPFPSDPMNALIWNLAAASFKYTSGPLPADLLLALFDGEPRAVAVKRGNALSQPVRSSNLFPLPRSSRRYAECEVEGKIFNCKIDTSTTWSWFPHRACSPDECPGDPKIRYDGIRRNAWYFPDFKIKNGLGWLRGPVYRDKICVFSKCADRVEFVGVTMVEGTYSDEPTNSVLALGRTQGHAATFFEELMQQEPRMRREFSVCLSDASSNVFLGRRQTNAFSGEVTKLPVLTRTDGDPNWVVDVNGFEATGFRPSQDWPSPPALDNLGYIDRPAKGVIDSGQDLYIMPRKALVALSRKIPGGSTYTPFGHPSDGYSWLVYPCGTLPTIIFHISARRFQIDPPARNEESTFVPPYADPQDWRPPRSPWMCFTNIASAPDVNVYVLGAPFLRRYYTIFSYGDKEGDEPYVGIAKKTDNCGAPRRQTDLKHPSGPKNPTKPKEPVGPQGPDTMEPPRA